MSWTADESWTVDDSFCHTADGGQCYPGGGGKRRKKHEKPETLAHREDAILMQFVQEYMKRAA